MTGCSRPNSDNVTQWRSHERSNPYIIQHFSSQECKPAISKKKKKKNPIHGPACRILTCLYMGRALKPSHGPWRAQSLNLLGCGSGSQYEEARDRPRRDVGLKTRLIPLFWLGELLRVLAARYVRSWNVCILKILVRENGLYAVG